jgi:hypothetical protein
MAYGMAHSTENLYFLLYIDFFINLFIFHKKTGDYVLHKTPYFLFPITTFSLTIVGEL